MFFLISLIFSAETSVKIVSFSEAMTYNPQACDFCLGRRNFSVEVCYRLTKTTKESLGRFSLKELPTNLEGTLELAIFSVCNREKSAISEEQEIGAKLAWVLELLKPGGFLLIPVSSEDYEKKHEVGLTDFLPEIYQKTAKRQLSSACPLSQTTLGPCDVIVVMKKGTIQRTTYPELGNIQIEKSTFVTQPV